MTDVEVELSAPNGFEFSGIININPSEIVSMVINNPVTPEEPGIDTADPEEVKFKEVVNSIGAEEVTDDEGLSWKIRICRGMFARVDNKINNNNKNSSFICQVISSTEHETEQILPTTQAGPHPVSAALTAGQLSPGSVPTPYLSMVRTVRVHLVRPGSPYHLFSFPY